MKIISGGQTGVDRAALDVAIERGMDWGGWCPKGGWAEDMRDPPGVLVRYPNLRETPENDPKQRTEWNIRDSDATLIVLPAGAPSPGTDFTVACAVKYAKPYIAIDPSDPDAAKNFQEWLNGFASVSSLNIAGPRESERPGIYAATRTLLDNVVKTRR